MTDDYIPEGYTAEQWAGMCACAEVLEFGYKRRSYEVGVERFGAHVVDFIGRDLRHYVANAPRRLRVSVPVAVNTITGGAVD